MKRNIYTTMPYRTVIRLLGVARNPANGFPARLLGHGPFRGEPVVQVCVGGEQQHCNGYVRRISRIGGGGRVQPGERGKRPDKPASPDIDPGHAAQFARLRQVEAPQESWKRAGRCARWIQDSSPSDWIPADCGWNEMCPSTRGGGLTLERKSNRLGRNTLPAFIYILEFSPRS